MPSFNRVVRVGHSGCRLRRLKTSRCGFRIVVVFSMVVRLRAAPFLGVPPRQRQSDNNVKVANSASAQN